MVRSTRSSLRGDTGAVAQLIVNGEPRAQGDLTEEGSSIQVEARPGDRVVATVNTIPLDNGIVGARLGKLHFVLENTTLPSRNTTRRLDHLLASPPR